MKKTDLAMIILIASVSVLIAYFVGKSIFGGASTGTVNVKTIDPISSTVEPPDPAIFNANAINPSVQVQIDSSAGS